MSLELKNVVKRVGADIHIHETNLTFAEGTFNVLLGTTRAGKTTLMQLMAGLERPTAGEVFFRGQNVSAVPVQKRNVADGLSAVHQLLQFHRLREYRLAAAGGRLPAGEIDARVSGTANLLHLAPLLDRRPAELSGGQQQRTAIARALAKDADLILLDEPLANLDYKLREELRDELPKLFAGRNCIVVYATTEPIEALLFGGHTATLHEGRVTQYGPTAEIYRHPRDITTARVFSDPPLNTAPITKQGGEILIGDSIRLPAGRFARGHSRWFIYWGIRPHHITAAARRAHLAARGPGAGDRALRIGEHRPFRPQWPHLGVAVARHPSIRGRQHRAPPCRCRRELLLRRRGRLIAGGALARIILQDLRHTYCEP